MQNIIFSTSSSKHLGIDSGGVEFGRFPDGEISVVLTEEVADKSVYIIGSTEPPAENLIELLLAVDAIARHHSGAINIVIPYFGYAKSDAEKIPGQTVSARVIAGLLEHVSENRGKLIALNLHSRQVEEFFQIPVTDISLIKEMSEKFNDIENLAVVSPDAGGRLRAEEFAAHLNLPGIAVIKKERLSDTKVKDVEMKGHVAGKNVVIVDDMVQSGGTIAGAVEFLKDHGARDIYLAITHMDYEGGGWKKIEANNLIKKVVTTNTIKPREGLSEKFEVIDISPVIKKICLGLEGVT